MEELKLTRNWDKVFPQSDKVGHKKVTFHNRYGIICLTLFQLVYYPVRMALYLVPFRFACYLEQMVLYPLRLSPLKDL